MTEYSETVKRQGLLLEAEIWANGIESIHGFDTRKVTMHYDEYPNDGNIVDITYNDGRIERLKKGKLIRTLGEKVQGKDLIDKYTRK
jgi:hypothetical protein